MMKRWKLALVGAAMVLSTAGACDPPPPPGWVRPQVENLVVAPAPVVPGEPFTVAATFIDDHHIALVDMWFISPNGREYRFCDLPGFNPDLDPQTEVDVVIPCEMPDFALNGTWKVVLNAYDGETFTGHGAGAGQATATFEAVGGTNDEEPPVVDAFTIEPASTPEAGRHRLCKPPQSDHQSRPESVRTKMSTISASTPRKRCSLISRGCNPMAVDAGQIRNGTSISLDTRVGVIGLS